MATIQIKRRTTAGTGPLTGTSGSVRVGEPLVDIGGEHLYIAKANKTGTSVNPLAAADYVAFPSVTKVNGQIDTKINALNLGTAATRNTGTGSGNIPILDSSGKLVDTIIPKIAITNTFVVATQSAMLALSTAQEGDIAVRTDLNKSFILKTNGFSTLANWQELLTPTDSVQSVNGKTGTVTISLSELGGVATGTYNTHVSSNLHLTQDQRDIIAGVINSRIAGAGGVSYISSLDAYNSAVIPAGLKLFTEVDTTYTPNRIYYRLGIDTDKVLQPSSIIDGGTY
ncbi:hypothetical protein [Liberiplasma polymorphum]|uniref:hypothetical protein n=1 Tax=Liberiplasma polymorphum TaxID=3374570 RepID=UPI003772D51E